MSSIHHSELSFAHKPGMFVCVSAVQTDKSSLEILLQLYQPLSAALHHTTAGRREEQEEIEICCRQRMWSGMQKPNMPLGPKIRE